MNTEAPATGLLHACLLDGTGRARDIERGEIPAWKPDDGILWLHIDFSKPDAAVLLDSELPVTLPDVAFDLLTDPETRPRALPVDDGLMVALRGVNMNPGENPADMVSIRAWVSPHAIITSRRRRLLAVQDIRGLLDKGDGPTTPGDFLGQLVTTLADRIGAYVDKIEDALLEEEDTIANDQEAGQRRSLSKIRRQIANVRRFVAPQRDALEKLHRYPAPWMSKEEVQALREEADRIARYVEDLDLARERSILLHEEYQGLVAQQQNSRMYVLSIVAAIFLPLTFVTGLLGMNVGGLPGVDSHLGFAWSVVIMVVCAIVAALILRLKRWM